MLSLFFYHVTACCSQVAKVAAERFPETLRALPAFKQALLRGVCRRAVV